ncbi:hypothetical protein [Odoribacter lunatus]|uniref:hypothetical protein n=1 Tax=Odoribacter lunatus TaxID=2941335 RepID=UPI00203BFFEE|nr:hypothetical protein [Odoribacter lunatus]
MSEEEKIYFQLDQNSQELEEAAMMYETSCHNPEHLIAEIPSELFQHMSQAALRDYAKGRSMTPEQLDSWVKERMAW